MQKEMRQTAKTLNIDSFRHNIDSKRLASMLLKAVLKNIPSPNFSTRKYIVPRLWTSRFDRAATGKK
tara:strand:- start:187 stop:387 length:201 start_codon:yes stop_codon:yes gene_type:complete